MQMTALYGICQKQTLHRDTANTIAPPTIGRFRCAGQRSYELAHVIANNGEPENRCR
jgi:hypothetical protein